MRSGRADRRARPAEGVEAAVARELGGGDATARAVARLHRLRDAAALIERHGLGGDRVGSRPSGDQIPPTPGGDPAGPAVLATPADVQDLVSRATARLRHGTDHTVVALVGSTGSGKSSLLNAVAGTEVARTGVTRPTTAVAQAVTVGAPAEALLDHLGITRRHHLAATPTAGGPAADVDLGVLDGLVLLDLPDVDSVATAHRAEVDRLIRLVDLMVFVTDPQKYGDEVLHAGYLRPLRAHADVIQVVLNKADLLDPRALGACLADLGRLLAEDGLPDVRPMAVSATGPPGVDALLGVLAAEVSAREAATARVHADVDAAVAALRDLAGSPGRVDLADVGATLATDLAAAAGVEDVAALVAAQHRRDAALATGWPPVRWARRIRRAPLAQLPVAADSQIAQAEVSRALRRAGTAVAEQVGPAWAPAVTATAREAAEPVGAALDRRTSREVQDLRRPRRWWGVVGLLQGVCLLVALAGGIWLAGLTFARSALLIEVEVAVVRVGAVPLPTLLLLGGLAAGLLLALIAGAIARAAARRRAAAARARLTEQAAAVADEEVLDRLRTVLADAEAAAGLLEEAGRR